MMIKIKNLHYQYKGSNHPILNGINLDVSKGITGILGKNGSGKSTLLKILATAIQVKQDIYFYKNTDVYKNTNIIRDSLGYLPQNFTFYHNLTAQQILEYIGLLKEVNKKELKNRIGYLLNFFNLFEVRDVHFGHLSGGMQQRVGLSQLFLNTPKIVLLDEPMQGLDPIEKKSLFSLLNEISNDSIVIISSHNVGDVQAICDKVIIQVDGSIKYQGVIGDLLDKQVDKNTSLEEIFVQIT